jgi:hypothetical protein
MGVACGAEVGSCLYGTVRRYGGQYWGIRGLSEEEEVCLLLMRGYGVESEPKPEREYDVPRFCFFKLSVGNLSGGLGFLSILYRAPL